VEQLEPQPVLLACRSGEGEEAVGGVATRSGQDAGTLRTGRLRELQQPAGLGGDPPLEAGLGTTETYDESVAGRELDDGSGSGFDEHVSHVMKEAADRRQIQPGEDP
jgi:hypothetical protein